MLLLELIGWLFFFFFVELFYFKIAHRYQIIDKPNNRSSHNYVTIRGGGIIFAIAACIGLFIFTQEYYLASGLLIISFISFLDDVKNITSLLRLVIQSVAVFLLLYGFYEEIGLLLILLSFVIVTGIINAYNFMDGINGITAMYTVTVLGSLFWVNYHYLTQELYMLYYLLFLSLLVFSFFNIRKIARCFAGDVGSVSIAFILCYLLMQLMIETQWIWWILFLGIYGVDTVFTIICRIFRKESLLQAHRSHFYQFLANELKWGHIQVGFMYACIQTALNFIVIYAYSHQESWIAVAGLFVFLIIYSIFRFRLEGHKRLFVTYNPD